MFRAQGSIVVLRPVEEVFALLPYAVTDNMQMGYPTWMREVREQAKEHIAYNHSLPSGKIEIGTIFQRQVQGPGIQTITYKVVELEPDRKLTLEQQNVGVFAASARMSYELEPVPEGTRLIMTGEAQAQGSVWLIYKAFNTIPRLKQLAISFSLRILKRTLEQGILLQPGHRISGPLPAMDESQLPPEAPQ